MLDDVDEFAACLGEAAGVPVPVIEGTIANAPAEGFIVLFGWDGITTDPHLGPRVVLINVNRSEVPHDLERYQLAAAVEKDRYFRWQHERARDSGRHLYGRKDVGRRIGATWPGGGWESESYGLLSSDRYPDLPGLLAGYLAAYEELLGPR
jgi:hypothetical protein